MPVNLLADLADARFGEDALARALRDAQGRGYRLVHAAGPDDRLCAWIDLQFAPSWWSSEVRAGEAWYALAPDGDIAGFAGFAARGLRFPWLKAYRERRDVGIFGPYGVGDAHRGTGLGAALLTAALASLRRHGYARALIPAVGGGRLIATYETRTGARVADTFDDEAPRRFRATILASGNGSNAQAVFDRVAAGTLALDVGAAIANAADAPVLDRARGAGVPVRAVVWDRANESRGAFDMRVTEAVAASDPELVLLLGWMHLLPPAFIARFPEILNIHPAFLPFDPRADDVLMPDGSAIPAFRGPRAVEAALAAGVAWAGASVHRVTAETDRGAIVVRTPFRVPADATQASFTRELRPREHAAVLSGIRRWIFEQS